jgi:hypothetical protein
VRPDLAPRRICGLLARKAFRLDLLGLLEAQSKLVDREALGSPPEAMALQLADDLVQPIDLKLHSTNPLERLNKEVKRRADVVGIFPNGDSIVRLIGAVLLQQNDEWQSQHRYMQVEAGSRILVAPGAEKELASDDRGERREARG